MPRGPAQAKGSAKPLTASATGKRLPGKGKTVVAHGGVRKPYRKRPGTAALQEIRQLQSGKKKLDHLIPLVHIERVAREIVGEVAASDDGLRLEGGVVDILREVAEVYMTEMFRQGVTYMAHAKRKMIHPSDIRLSPIATSLFEQLDEQIANQATGTPSL